MLKIFNELKPFFEDVFRELSVREYAKITNVSPPTASKILKQLAKQELLIQKKDRIYLLFRANKENNLFKDLARTYWRDKLSKLTEKLHKDVLFKDIILFGSLAKVENRLDSDVDLFIGITKRDINVESLEKELNRNVQVHFKEALKNSNLKNNIEKGVLIR